MQPFSSHLLLTSVAHCRRDRRSQREPAAQTRSMRQRVLHRPQRKAPPSARLQASACNSMMDRCPLGKAPVMVCRMEQQVRDPDPLHALQTIGHLRTSVGGWQPACLAIRLFGKLDQHFFTDWDLRKGWAPCIYRIVSLVPWSSASDHATS